MKAVKNRLNELNVETKNISFTSNNLTNLSSQLRQYNISDGELDDLTNTRILLGIFKCVNIIKNILIAGIVLGIVGVVLSLFIGK